MSAPDPETQTILINHAILQGDKIRAIKLYREQTHVGLAEAKHAIERREAELRGASPASFPLPSTDAPNATPESQALLVKEALFRGDLITAIKLYRAQTGLGLKEAKVAVERLQADLRRDEPHRFTSRRGPAASLATIIGAIAIVLTLLLLILTRLKLAH